MTSQFWLWLDAIAMAVGAALILVIGKRRTASEEGHTIYHGIVPIIAACSYLAMALNQGSLVLPVGELVNPAQGTALVVGRTFYFARYIDWAFTTPLLLLPLALVATHSAPRRPNLIAGLLLADLLMVVTALFFGLSVDPVAKWLWFIVSCGAFLAVYWVMWVPLRQQAAAEREDVRSNYGRNAAVLSVLWLIYPIILLFGTDGLGVMGPVLSVASIAVLDFVSKVIYGLMTVGGFARITERDLQAAPATGAATLRTAA